MPLKGKLENIFFSEKKKKEKKRKETNTDETWYRYEGTNTNKDDLLSTGQSKMEGDMDIPLQLIYNIIIIYKFGSAQTQKPRPQYFYDVIQKG